MSLDEKSDEAAQAAGAEHMQTTRMEELTLSLARSAAGKAGDGQGSWLS